MPAHQAVFGKGRGRRLKGGSANLALCVGPAWCLRAGFRINYYRPSTSCLPLQNSQAPNSQKRKSTGLNSRNCSRATTRERRAKTSCTIIAKTVSKPCAKITGSWFLRIRGGLMRKNNWKLVFAHPGRTYEESLPGENGQPGPSPEDHAFPKALYNLARDPGERYNVLEQNPKIVAELEELAETAREDLGDDLQGRKGKNVRLMVND